MNDQDLNHRNGNPPGMMPCPFCGGTDTLVERLDNCSAYVMCSSMLDEHSYCTAQGPVGIQEDDGEELPGAAAAIAAWNQRTSPAAAATVVPLAQDHIGTRVDAYGILGRIRDGRYFKGLNWGCGEMLRHLEEMAERYYTGDIAAVDEFLQLYCLDDARPRVAAAQHSAPSAAATITIGETHSPVKVRLGLRLIGDEEVATVTLTQHDRTVTLYVADQAHAAQIAAAIQGHPPLAAEAPRVEAKATAMTDYQLVPLPPTPEMVSAAEDAYMPFGDMELAIRMAILAAPAVQGEPVGEVRFELGAPSSIFAELYSKSLPVLAPGTKLYAAPQPEEQQPDVTQLVEALEQAGLALHEMDDGHAALVDIDNALAAYRKGGDA